MSYLNEVIEAIEDHGHVARFSGTDHHEPQSCKRCDVQWPCPTVQLARSAVRRRHGVKAVAA